MYRDPFETREEFAKKLADREWYAGEVELIRMQYDIYTGKFPLQWTHARFWLETLQPTDEELYLILHRDQARALCERGSRWPVYARLSPDPDDATLESLELVVGDERIKIELPVWISQLG